MELLPADFRSTRARAEESAPARPTAAPPVLPHFPGYEDLEFLARGGMGVVYQARDVRSGRAVAVKVLNAAVATAEETARFDREGAVLAGLSHPNVVPVFDIGRRDDFLYLAMPLVVGGSLDRQIHRFRGNPTAAAALVEKVARALHHAHGLGVWHRDLKPANILLSEGDEPLVSDFGLAGDADAALLLTRVGQPIGTPLYMAPEQIRASGPVGVGADVWGLGLLLYELLSGVRPFHGATREVVWHQILSETPVPLRSLLPNLDPALDAVVQRCLQREPRDRYPTAAAAADDLRRWLDRKPRPLRRSRRRLVFVALAVGLVLSAFVAFRPDSSHSKTPTFSVGRTTTLVADAGGVSWSHWRGTPGLMIARNRLSFGGVVPVLLDLAPAVPAKSFRFQAEAQFPEGAAEEFGIFWDASDHGGYHTFSALAFNAAHGSPRASVGAYAVRDETSTVSSQFHRATLAQHRFETAVDPNAWHRLTVVVAPTVVQAFWDDLPLPEVQTTKLSARRRFVLESQWGQAPPNAPAPGGALGLYVQRGLVDYRNVTIEPLP